MAARDIRVFRQNPYVPRGLATGPSRVACETPDSNAEYGRLRFPQLPASLPHTLAMLDIIDRLVNSAEGRVVRLDAVPKVYLDEDGVTFDPVGPEIPVPDDETLLFLLGQRYPGVTFDLPDQVPRLHPADPVASTAFARPG